MKVQLQKIHAHFVVDVAVGEALSKPIVGEPFYMVYEDDGGLVRDVTTSPIVEVYDEGDGFYHFFTKNSNYYARYL